MFKFIWNHSTTYSNRSFEYNCTFHASSTFSTNPFRKLSALARLEPSPTPFWLGYPSLEHTLCAIAPRSTSARSTHFLLRFLGGRTKLGCQSLTAANCYWFSRWKYLLLALAPGAPTRSRMREFGVLLSPTLFLFLLFFFPILHLISNSSVSGANKRVSWSVVFLWEPFTLRNQNERLLCRST